ncbi:MAG: hypothetical protein K0S47_338 [Herbinix sp.]|nr:hypothetical protein [Herbinix sp.]
MKKQVIGAALAITVAATSLPITSSQYAMSAQTNGGFVVPELIAWYGAPAKDWESEATPIGNGFIGGMIFGGIESDVIQINEHTLWSGGPGANVNYDGGINGEAGAIQDTLQKVRNLLQDKMSDFTKNHGAYIDDASGKVISEDYALEDEELQGLINGLMGEKDNFGDYQTFGNIVISDAATAGPRIEEVTSNCDSYSEAEKYDKLFDGSLSTKWYSVAGAPEGYTVPSPVWIGWKYNQPVTAASYQMVSGNDVPDRDPKDWKLYGSNDGKTYELIDDRSGEVFTGRNQSRTFELKKEVSYQYYKIEILSTFTEGTPCQLTEIILGDQTSKVEPSYDNYRRELNIDKSIASVSYAMGGVNYKREYFISNPGNVIVIRLTADQKGKLTKNIALTSEQTKKHITVEDNVITMTGQPADQREDGLKFAGQLKVIASGGSVAKKEASIDVKAADEILLIMSTATNYQQCNDDSFDYFSDKDPLLTVKENVNKASEMSYQQLFDEHVRDYTTLYDRVKVNLGDVLIPSKSTDQLLAGYNGRGENPNTKEEDRYLEMLYYQFGRYLLISSSREGSLPANLQGIWAQGLSSPWNSDYHTNINLQMNYWLAEQTNLRECHLPLIDYINSLVPRGSITAQTYYCTQEGEEVRGWVTHHENNIWGNTGPGNYYYGFYFPAAAAWLCQDIWEYYTFNQDKNFLKENYNTLLQSALFWVDNLWTDARDGSLVANPSYSPEHGPYSLGAAADQGIIWEIFDEVLRASEVLGITSSELDEIKAAKEKLSGPKIGLSGQFMEWKDEITLDITGDAGHRHANHLFALHPGTQIVAGRSEEEDAYVEAMKNTLNTRGDGGTGWSKAWKINFWARLRDGNHAHKLVEEILSESTLKNLFDTHPPFQIDGNFGATAGMSEMLLQSQGNTIDLLPSLPSDWATGDFSGLKARGNFDISVSWENMIAQNVLVTSLTGNDCVLNYYGLSKATVIRDSDGEKVEVTVLDEDTISFKTKPGETYVISDIPQDRVFSDPREFMKSTVENLYNPSIVSKLEAPGKAGVYIENISPFSFATVIGLKENDLIIEVNGQAVKDTNGFLSMYESSSEGDVLGLKIWREKAYEYLFFVKSSYDDYKMLPGQIEVEDYDELYGNGMKTDTCGEGGMNLGFIAGGDFVVFHDMMFKEVPVKFNIRSAGTSANPVYVRLDAVNGPIVAQVNVTPTGEWQTYTTSTAQITDGSTLTGGHDFYLILNAGMNVNWISFESDGTMMPDIELLSSKNEYVNVLENCKLLVEQEYTPESYGPLKTVIATVDGKLNTVTSAREFKDMAKKLTEAKQGLVAAVKESSTEETIAKDEVVMKKNNIIPYIAAGFILLAGAVTFLLILKRRKIK